MHSMIFTSCANLIQTVRYVRTDCCKCYLTNIRYKPAEVLQSFLFQWPRLVHKQGPPLTSLKCWATKPSSGQKLLLLCGCSRAPQVFHQCMESPAGRKQNITSLNSDFGKSYFPSKIQSLA